VGTIERLLLAMQEERLNSPEVPMKKLEDALTVYPKKGPPDRAMRRATIG
jgi:hypothetical protein